MCLGRRQPKLCDVAVTYSEMKSKDHATVRTVQDVQYYNENSEATVLNVQCGRKAMVTWYQSQRFPQEEGHPHVVLPPPVHRVKAISEFGVSETTTEKIWILSMLNT